MSTMKAFRKGQTGRCECGKQFTRKMATHIKCGECEPVPFSLQPALTDVIALMGSHTILEMEDAIKRLSRAAGLRWGSQRRDGKAIVLEYRVDLLGASRDGTLWFWPSGHWQRAVKRDKPGSWVAEGEYYAIGADAIAHSFCATVCRDDPGAKYNGRGFAFHARLDALEQAGV